MVCHMVCSSLIVIIFWLELLILIIINHLWLLLKTSTLALSLLYSWHQLPCTVSNKMLVVYNLLVAWNLLFLICSTKTLTSRYHKMMQQFNGIVYQVLGTETLHITSLKDFCIHTNIRRHLNILTCIRNIWLCKLMIQMWEKNQMQFTLLHIL